MLIKLKKIRLKNFISTGNVIQEIEIDTSILTLIVGEIAESSDMKNGAGKTTILQAVSYALFGKPLTNIKIPNLVNNQNKKAMTVTLEFEVGDTQYRIERGQKPAFLKFFVNDKEMKKDGEENDALGENRFTQVEINRIIGMSPLLFKHIVALNTFTIPFLREREAVQREIAEELLSITQLSAKSEQLKAMLTVTKDGIKEQQALTKATADANARIEQTLYGLEDTERKWLANHEATIVSLRGDIESLVQIDYEAALAAFDAQDAYDAEARRLKDAVTPLRASAKHHQDNMRTRTLHASRLKAALADAGTGLADRLARDITRKEADIERHRKQGLALEKTRAKLQNDRLQDDDQTCACCGQALAGTDHLAAVHAALEAQLEENNQAILREEASVRDRYQEIDAIRREIAHAIEAAAEKVADTQKQIADFQAEEAGFATTLAALNEEIATYDGQIAALGLRPLVPFSSRDDLYQTRAAQTILERDLENELAQQNPYRDQIVAIGATIQDVDYTTLNALSSDLKHQEFLFKLLSSKDSFVRKKIIDQNVPHLNERIGHYLQALSLPHSVVFQSDLSVEITYRGNDYDFEQLSRGEMNRVIMATAFAFRDVWENLNHPINLLWVDELLDQGTCTPGVEAALGILHGMGMKRGKNVFLVSHKNELRSRINDVMTCRKEKDFTTFEIGSGAA